MAKPVTCKQLFPAGCDMVLKTTTPGELITEAWEHTHQNPAHADIRDELSVKEGFDLKDWQKHIVKLWSELRQEESDKP